MIALLSRRPDAAGRAALAAYRGQPLGARLHTVIRWWTAPFPAVEAVLPRAGRILEIGCGHGLFCVYAALRSAGGPSGAGRSVLGVDIDVAKIRQAAAVAAGLSSRSVSGSGSGSVSVSFQSDESGAVPPPGPWDAVVIVDMLYLLPAEAQRALLVAAAAQLAPGGVLVVKEMGVTPRWKARWNRFQETLSVKVLRITEGHDFDFIAPEEMAAWLADAGLTTSLRRLDRGRLHPHHLLTGRRTTSSRLP